MKYLLDTNVWSQTLRLRSTAVLRRFRQVVIEDQNAIASCVIVKAELIYGAVKAGRFDRRDAAERLLQDYVNLQFEDRCVAVYASIRYDVDDVQKMPIGSNDLLVASIAIANGLKLVSHDAHFRRIAGLALEDWQTDDPNQPSP